MLVPTVAGNGVWGKTTMAAMVLVAAVWLSGCASPIPFRHVPMPQQKLQAVQHWDALAAEVAKQIALTLKGIADGPGKKVHVQADPETPFGAIFAELLTTRLVQAGIAVSDDPMAPGFTAENRVQVLRHRAQRHVVDMWGSNATHGGPSSEVVMLRAHDESAAGSATLSAGGVAGGLPHTELIITSELRQADRYLMRRSDIFYINDPDFWHYQKLAPGLPPPVEKSTREMPVKG